MSDLLVQELRELVICPGGKCSCDDWPCDFLHRAAEALDAARQREQALSVALEEVLEHVEGAAERIENQCTLCNTYRAKIRAALVFGRADRDPAVPGLTGERAK